MRIFIVLIWVNLTLGAFTQTYNCSSMGETPCNMNNQTGCCPAKNACCCPDQKYCCTESSEACLCKGICPGANCTCYGCSIKIGYCEKYCPP